MINNFKTFNNDVIIPIDIEYPIDLGKNVEEHMVLQYLNSPQIRGLSWEYDNRVYYIKDEKASVQGFPSIDLLHIVVIYNGTGSKYPPPNNAVIYNLDATVHKELQMPELISEHIVNRLTFDKADNPPLPAAKFEGGLYFAGFGWRKDQAGELVNSISIIYDQEWYEVRLLDSNTGQIGKCLISGMI